MRKKIRFIFILVTVCAGSSVCVAADKPVPDNLATQPGLINTEFIFENAAFPQCHASSIVETKNGLLAVWFGGTREGSPDVNIWQSRRTDCGWTLPVAVADGIQNSQQRYPCWNPVLFQPAKGELILFYKVGPDVKSWRGMMKKSADNGEIWSQAFALPNGFLGPIKNKPLELHAKVLLCPSSTENDGWRVHFEKYFYSKEKWEKTAPLNDGKKFQAIQPTILTIKKGLRREFLALCRTKQSVAAQIRSYDDGDTWSDMTASTLPNPSAGFDAITLKNATHLLVYNHTDEKSKDSPRAREMLNVAVSPDGINWYAALILEYSKGCEFSYPAVIQTNDGLVHITYTWKRQRIKHAVVDVNKLMTFEIKDGRWPFEKF